MKARDFCYWLQGYFEVADNNNAELTAEQVRIIRAHLNMVFAHEIDPSMGDKDHQETLNKIHDTKYGPPTDTTMRC